MNDITSREMPHVLVVDDDREIRALLKKFLAKHGFNIETAGDGREATKALQDWRIDLIVLDIMLPGEDGLQICRRVRATSNIPIIMLTAVGDEMDRIVGIEMGADDYLVKPFSPRELLARIKAVLRRTQSLPRGENQGTSGSVLSFGGWSLNKTKRVLKNSDGVAVDLSGGEYDLLIAFVDHPQRVLNRDQLLDFSRGRIAAPFDRSVDVQVGRLRQKIETDPKNPEIIKTVRGGGYIFTPSVETDETPDS
jgi:two-component system OmpR family response regulator